MDARKAEREENGSTGIQFAYVDHNGNLTDTPPDPDLKVEIELEDIAVSVPKKEDLPEEDPVRKGKVSFFDSSKGFGFITQEQGEDIFVHFRSITGDGYKSLDEGQQVEFNLVPGDKGLQAEDVALV